MLRYQQRTNLMLRYQQGSFLASRQVQVIKL
jgi:hypothetical protein